MLKQIFSISFLILANIVILSHGVIPHHHHDQQVCFEHTRCGDDHSHGPQIPFSQGEKEHGRCELVDVLIITPHTNSHEFNCPCCIHENKHFSDYQALNSGSGMEAMLFSVPLAFRQNPFPVSRYLSMAGHNLGLRAPPVA